MFTADDYLRMRATVAESFFDECQLGVVPAFQYGGADTVPRDAEYGAAVACGFLAAPIGETGDGSQAVDFDAILRLPVDTAITGKDRVKVIRRHGSALATPEVYTVEGKPAMGPTALVLKLKLITGNSSR